MDTNHCSSILEGDQSAFQAMRLHSAVMLSSSVIVAGELRFMAQNSERQSVNIMHVELFLAGINVCPIDIRIAVIYGDLKADLFRRYGPRERGKRRHTRLIDLGFDDNDLWIAATALHHNLTLVSSDSDFTRIQTVCPLRLESWLVPPIA